MGEVDYLQALGRFMADYERQRFAVDKADPLESLKHLMEQREMRPGDLGKLIGPSAASMVLQGKRQLSKSPIRVLAAFFKVSPALFL